MRRIPRRVWRAVHLSSYVLFWSATFHFILAGTDSPHPLARLGIDIVAAAVVFLTLVRILSPRGRPRSDRGANSARPRPLTRPARTRSPQPAAGRS
jgi:DMSO/TMAO reductase YedYZ heme-binding membrane subunit